VLVFRKKKAELRGATRHNNARADVKRMKIIDENYAVARARRLRRSFLMRLRCHFQRIWPFFFQRRELRFMHLLSYAVIYKAFVSRMILDDL
jgi:hypothetical protein